MDGVMRTTLWHEDSDRPGPGLHGRNSRSASLTGRGGARAKITRDWPRRRRDRV